MQEARCFSVMVAWLHGCLEAHALHSQFCASYRSQHVGCLTGTPGSEDHWWDLCAGPHVAATGDILPDALDLESVAGLPDEIG